VTFSANFGSLDSLNLRVKCGFKPASAQMRCTLVWLMPISLAIVRALQCVALAGVSFSKRKRITRPLRLRGGVASRESASHERPRREWIEIPVPAIVSAKTFDLAAERLESNKRHAPRRTVEPSVVQGLVSCRKCAYAMYRTSTRSSARKIYYYRCLGSDAYRHLNHPLCDTHPVRMDLLDAVVWDAIVELLEGPALIQAEIDRRLETARQCSPTKRRAETL